MPPAHGDRLSAIDLSFLAAEDGSSGTHAHIGAVMTFAGPPAGTDELAAHVEARLAGVPRYRQRLAHPPLGAGRPVWVDAPDFRLDYHLRRTALASPGGNVELRALVGRVFSQRLDRSKPLWELWVVEGLAGGRWALLNKTNHAMIDGVSGMDIVSVLLDPAAAGEPGVRPWRAAPLPGAPQLLSQALLDGGRSAVSLAARALWTAASPRRSLRAAGAIAKGLGEVAWTGVDAAPRTPFNVSVGPHRRVAFADVSLADVRAVKAALGGTVNDVVLAAVAGGLRAWLHGRGVRTTDLPLRAGVPVSVRTPDGAHEHGNRITMLVVGMPVWCPDAAARLALVREATAAAKRSGQALGAATLIGLSGFAPPTLFGVAARASFSPRFVNLVVTNVPGPQHALSLLDRTLERLQPVGFVGEGFGLTIAVMSYDGTLSFGLIGERDAVHDIDVLARAISVAMDELRSAASATAKTTAPPRERRRKGAPA